MIMAIGVRQSTDNGILGPSISPMADKQELLKALEGWFGLSVLFNKYILKI